MKKWLWLVVLLIPFQVKAFQSSASTTILMDMDSKSVLYGNNMHNVRSVASISKIMTAVLAVESGKLNDTVIIDDSILKAYGSAIYLQVGEELTLENLVYGLMLRSGNDASLAIANYVGGTADNFISMMNDKAKKIGMKNTTFNNPNGLDDKGGNLSSAYDMALLTSYAMQNEIYKTVVGTKKYTLKTNMNYYSWDNKHKLLSSYKYATGGKTGFTDIAKRTLVTTASKDNMNLVVVTLNDGNDFGDHVSLFEEAFSKYTNHQILKKGNITIIGEKYYHGGFYINNDYFVTLEDKNNQVILNFKLDKKPDYKDNDVVGIVEVIINDEIVHEENIYVHREEKSLWDKIKDWFKHDK